MTNEEKIGYLFRAYSLKVDGTFYDILSVPYIEEFNSGDKTAIVIHDCDEGEDYIMEIEDMDLTQMELLELVPMKIGG